MNPKLIAIGLKLRKLYAEAAEPVRIHEEILDDADGSAVYVFQARFSNHEQAEIYKKLCETSAELEKAMKT